MKTIIFFLFIIYSSTCLFSTIINVPTEQPTIQAGINSSVNTDTVLVQPGTYLENINYNGKNITVASLFLTTQDTTYIPQTVIDGNQNGSVVTFESEEDSSAMLCGFTVTNGFDYQGGGIYCGYYYCNPSIMNVIISDNSASMGGGLMCNNSSPNLVNVTIINNSSTDRGGGIYCYVSNPSLVNATISGNSTDDKGGGIYCGNSNMYLENVSISGNNAFEKGGGIHFNNSILTLDINNRCSIFSNNIVNTRGLGKDIFFFDCDIIQIIVDTFTVMTPTDYYASPIDNFTFDILHCVVDNLINADVYVSVDGDNSNSGLSIDQPFKTITNAIEKIYTDSLNIHTIYLASGVYSPSTNGETFPIHWNNHVNLSGSSEDDTILDAESTSGVMNFDCITDAVISNITISNGHEYLNGGGIHFTYSYPLLQNVIISENSSVNYGGGICFYNSSPSFENVTISNNTAGYIGGGIYCTYNSNPNLENVTITENNAERGGGIFCYNSDPRLENVTITGNSAEIGGGIYTGFSNITLINCILWNDLPQEICFIEYSEPSSVTLEYSDIQGGEAGIVTNNNGTVIWLDGNIEVDPLFIDPLNNDYHLSVNSPCIDAGDPSFPLDPDNTICDIGAFYYHQDQEIVIDEIFPEPDSLFISEADSINFYIVANDPDGNPIEYCWELDEEILCVDSFYTFYTDENSAGEYSMLLNITDNYQPQSRDSLNFVWNIVVEELVGVQDVVPKITRIYQNFPNPFNPVTTINYDLSQKSEVLIEIYNIKGQKVKQLVNELKTAGEHSIKWNGKNDNGRIVSNGIYLYKIKSKDIEKSKKMLLLK